MAEIVEKYTASQLHDIKSCSPVMDKMTVKNRQNQYPSSLSRLRKPLRKVTNNSLSRQFSISKQENHPNLPNRKGWSSMKLKRALFDFDCEVERRCQQIRHEGSFLNFSIGQTMDLWKQQIPARVLKMPITQLVSQFHGNMNDALRSQIQPNPLKDVQHAEHSSWVSDPMIQNAMPLSQLDKGMVTLTRSGLSDNFLPLKVNSQYYPSYGKMEVKESKIQKLESIKQLEQELSIIEKSIL